jgi:rod shape-determining protein MreD
MIKQSQGGLTIIATIIVSIILTLIPLPDEVRVARPEWVLLVLIYWNMALSQRIGVGYAWLIGLIMDLIMGGALGVFAFCYALIIYVVTAIHLQLRQYPVWQQGLSIFSLILLMHLLLVVVTPRTMDWTFALSALTSTLIWPVIYALLRNVRRTFNVS